MFVASASRKAPSIHECLPFIQSCTHPLTRPYTPTSHRYFIMRTDGVPLVSSLRNMFAEQLFESLLGKELCDETQKILEKYATHLDGSSITSVMYDLMFVDVEEGMSTFKGVLGEVLPVQQYRGAYFVVGEVHDILSGAASSDSPPHAWLTISLKQRQAIVTLQHFENSPAHMYRMELMKVVRQRLVAAVLKTNQMLLLKQLYESRVVSNLLLLESRNPSDAKLLPDKSEHENLVVLSKSSPHLVGAHHLRHRQQRHNHRSHEFSKGQFKCTCFHVMEFDISKYGRLPIVSARDAFVAAMSYCLVTHPGAAASNVSGMRFRENPVRGMDEAQKRRGKSSDEGGKRADWWCLFVYKGNSCVKKCEECARPSRSEVLCSINNAYVVSSKHCTYAGHGRAETNHIITVVLF